MVNPAYRKDDGTFDFEKICRKCLLYACKNIKMLPTKSVNPEDFASYACIWYLENKKRQSFVNIRFLFIDFLRKKTGGGAGMDERRFNFQAKYNERKCSATDNMTDEYRFGFEQEILTDGIDNEGELNTKLDLQKKSSELKFSSKFKKELFEAIAYKGMNRLEFWDTKSRRMPFCRVNSEYDKVFDRIFFLYNNKTITEEVKKWLMKRI